MRSPARAGHLRTKHRPLLLFLLDVLQHAHDKLYRVRAQVLDTRVHGGLPQSRARVYVVVGWQCDKEVSPFSWPAPTPMLKPEDILTAATESLWKLTKGMRHNLVNAAMRQQGWSPCGKGRLMTGFPLDVTGGGPRGGGAAAC